MTDNDIDLDERLYERQLDPPATTDEDARADEADDFSFDDGGDY